MRNPYIIRVGAEKMDDLCKWLDQLSIVITKRDPEQGYVHIEADTGELMQLREDGLIVE